MSWIRLLETVEMIVDYTVLCHGLDCWSDSGDDSRLYSRMSWIRLLETVEMTVDYTVVCHGLDCWRLWR